jgi:hypothetical protein
MDSIYKIPFLPYKCYSYVSFKKIKTYKVCLKKKKPIKCSYVERKKTSNSLRKIKTLISLTLIQLAFQKIFFVGVYIVKKTICMLFKMIFFINFLSLEKL